MKNAIAIAIVLSCLAMIGTFPNALAMHSIPFNGSMAGNGTAASHTTNSITATAYLTGLGKTELVGVTTVSGFSECGGFVGTEQDTLTAANGDQVSISGIGHSCVGSAANLFEDTVTFTITSGTGRFANASGSGTIHTSIVITSPTSSTFTATITGSLAF